MSDVALSEQWARVRAEHRAALIPYLTAGYPSRATSLAALKMMPQVGADFVEVGVPFSDPLADGPVIQESSQVALAGGMTVAGTLELIRDAALEIPVIAFGYLNPIFAYGLTRFLDEAVDVGVAGLLIIDLPAGEDPEVEREVGESPLALVRLVAPTTDADRLEQTARAAQGFIYLISRLGVTGPPTTLGHSLAGTVGRIRRATQLPIAIGFGIASGEQAAQAARLADGVVVGSALVRRLAEGLGAARELMDELREALRSVAAAPGDF